MAAQHFVTVSNGTVTGTGYTPDGTIPKGAVVCTEDQARTAGPWSLVDSHGTLVVGTPPGPSPAMRARAALAAGLAVTSASTQALTGIYSCDAAALSRFGVEVASI